MVGVEISTSSQLMLMVPVWDHTLRTTVLDYWQENQNLNLPITKNFNAWFSYHFQPMAGSKSLRSVEECQLSLPWLRLALKCLAFFFLLISIFYSYQMFTDCRESSVLFQGRRSIINTWHMHPILLLMFYWYWSIRTMGLQTRVSESWWKLSALPLCMGCPCNDL